MGKQACLTIAGYKSYKLGGVRNEPIPPQTRDPGRTQRVLRSQTTRQISTPAGGWAGTGSGSKCTVSGLSTRAFMLDECHLSLNFFF